MPDPYAQLDYAPPPPLLRRRRFRLALVLLLLAAAAGAAVRWGPPGWQLAWLLYRQRQCLRYEAPPDRVVYDQCPDTAPGLIRRGGEYFAAPASGPAAVVAGHEPKCLTEFGRLAAAATSPGRAGAVLFLHERRTPAGARRLVVVRSGYFGITQRPLFIPGFDVEATVVEPGTWRTAPADRSLPEDIDVMSAAAPAPPKLRVFAGQADPADPAHFTIRYELDGRPHVVDGWLRDNGQVDFKQGG